MKSSRSFRPGYETVLLVLLLAALATSAFLVMRSITRTRRGLIDRDWMKPQEERGVVPFDFQSLENTVASAGTPVQSTDADAGLLVSELRVVAIGSAYPIPYEAEVCPFSNTPQPAMNQLDRDGDGITDDWELKYGFNKYNAADALEDNDGDGFTNIEEFQADTDPHDSASHPPYATKLRFVRRLDIPFPIVFQGVTELPDSEFVFQINTPADGNTYFKGLGDDLGKGLRDDISPEIKESLKGIVVQEFIPAEGLDQPARLIVMRGSTPIELIKGQKTTDPESQVELINVLDHSSEIATMGALLSLHNDEYTVLGVFEDRVVLERMGTGEVFDIVGLADGEPQGSPEDLE